MRVSWRSLLVAGVVTVALVVAGVLLIGGDDTEAPSAGRSFTTTSLAEVDTSALGFTRGPFCDDIDPRQVEAALGGEPAGQSAWQNGDRVQVTAQVTDVAHEFGCLYAAADGTAARAWVFAPPVTPDRAAALAAAPGHAGPAVCTGAAPTAFGLSGTRDSCLGEAGQSIVYRGLFGDAWLTCELTDPGGGDLASLSDRADRWCAGVLASQR